MPITVIAYRGASAYAPENTFAAFDRAIAMRATEIEFDVRMTKDGYPIVLHDDCVDWTTNGRGMIEDLRYEDIKDLDAGSWYGATFKTQRIPLLQETIEKYSDKCRMYVGVKSRDTGVASEVISLINRGGATHSSVFITDYIDVARHVRRKEPEISVNWGPLPFPSNGITDASNNSLASISIHYDQLTQDFVSKARAGKLKVLSYGSDSARDWRKAFLCGVDGLYSGTPDVAMFYLEYLARESEKASSDALWKKK